jgi:UDP-N-acetyl-D-mannosaminuronic acid dehydrogenase
VNIAFANELSIICDKLDINVWELIRLANRHPRVSILQPGPGVGGHCIAVDPWFIVSSVPDQARIIKTARRVNTDKPDYVVSKVLSEADKLTQPVLACLGLAFKPDIDDLRESPSLLIVEKLAENSAIKLLVVEPNIDVLPKSLSRFENVSLVNLDTAIAESNIVVGLVKHKQFVAALSAESLKEYNFIDFSNIAIFK